MMVDFRCLQGTQGQVNSMEWLQKSLYSKKGEDAERQIMTLLEEALCNTGVQTWKRLACEVVSSPSPGIVKQSLAWELEL